MADVSTNIKASDDDAAKAGLKCIVLIPKGAIALGKLAQALCRTEFRELKLFQFLIEKFM